MAKRALRNHPKALTEKESFICLTLHMRKYCLASLKVEIDGLLDDESLSETVKSVRDCYKMYNYKLN